MADFPVSRESTYMTEGEALSLSDYFYKRNGVFYFRNNKRQVCELVLNQDGTIPLVKNARHMFPDDFSTLFKDKPDLDLKRIIFEKLRASGPPFSIQSQLHLTSRYIKHSRLGKAQFQFYRHFWLVVGFFSKKN